MRPAVWIPNKGCICRAKFSFRIAENPLGIQKREQMSRVDIGI
jgi:hypothetical protein